MAKSTESLDYARLAAALMDRFEANAEHASARTVDTTPGWFDELLEALAPLKGLSPARGKLSEDQSARLMDIQRALARVDLSDAGAPAAVIGVARF